MEPQSDSYMAVQLISFRCNSEARSGIESRNPSDVSYAKFLPAAIKPIFTKLLVNISTHRGSFQRLFPLPLEPIRRKILLIISTSSLSCVQKKSFILMTTIQTENQNYTNAGIQDSFYRPIFFLI